jgi:hypothetical protein
MGKKFGTDERHCKEDKDRCKYFPLPGTVDKRLQTKIDINTGR